MTKEKEIADSNDIWVKHEIPAFEFCRLQKASALLNCDVDDLLHWAQIGAIELCVYFHGFEATIDKLDWIENYGNKKKLIFDWLDEQKDYFGGMMFPFSVPGYPLSSFFPKFTIDTTNEEPYVNYILEGERFIKPLVSLFGYWALFTGLYENPFSMIRNSGYVRFTPLDFRVKAADCEDKTVVVFASPPIEYLYKDGLLTKEPETLVTITPDDLWITKCQINKIAKYAGKSMPNYINGGIELDSFPQDSKIQDKTRTTANQSQMIAALLKAIGINDNDQKSDSAEHLLSIISNKLSSMKIDTPDVTPKTLDNWLKRAGTRS